MEAIISPLAVVEQQRNIDISDILPFVLVIPDLLDDSLRIKVYVGVIMVLF